MVKEVHLVVPHSWIYLEVKDAKGEPQMWALEATGRTGFRESESRPTTSKPGDTVKARCHHLRDGSNGCLLGFLKAKDGTVKDWDGNNAPPPGGFLRTEEVNRSEGDDHASIRIRVASHSVHREAAVPRNGSSTSAQRTASRSISRVQPKVTETTWKSQMEYILPARVYSVDRGREHYSMTVVDYSGLEQQGIERVEDVSARQRAVP